MKATLIIVSLFTVTISLEAQYYFDQWYFKKCQVTSINNCTHEEFECLWTEATRLGKTGKKLTAVGMSAMALPLLIAIANPYAVYSLLITVPVGVLLDIIGIPCIVKGRNRLNQLKNTPYYKSQSAVALNLNPTILRNHINNTYSVGLTAKISF
jgi:hypothetical protein